ncbi:DUF2271 domain-containing protein [Sporomusa termitida]|uniref:Uncharacterized protein n=1 Tax=Sporomusa termitida TaxID=2377 RepID=A0A517DRA4_9FIRM|nr:DUF2271 domain-containing protein [Sporomusa termitida]QDR79885.1 hypothetical protein SPTER_11870 [Sporomusa termitida]
MRIFNLLLLLALSAALLAACGNTNQPVRKGALQEYSPRAGTEAAAPAVQSPGQVTVSFDYQRQREIASDQLAVWIEDTQGRHIRTLLVTRFTANGGYQKRAETVPHWQQAFQPAGAGRQALDAVSSATPQSGPVSVIWDCRNQAGEAVPAGPYVYKAEANIKWAKTALWQGTLPVGSGAAESAATAVTGDGILLQAVRASFAPAP